MVVGTHNFVGSASVYQLLVSPDGARIIMFWVNVGKTVEILKAITPWFKPNIEAVFTLDFNTTNLDNSKVFDNFAYIQHEGLDLPWYCPCPTAMSPLWT